MRRFSRLAVLSLTLLVPSFFYGDVCTELTAAKTKVYGFRPSQLAREKLPARLQAVDAFHAQVSAAGAAGQACLRNLMAQEKSDAFFVFDSAQLLSALDVTGASDGAIETGLLRADFADASAARYLEVALLLSRRGRDIGKVAAHYLHAPNVDTNFPHSTEKLDRTSGALLLYGSMPPDLVDEYLAKEVNATELHVRDAVAAVWVTNMTERSFAGIAKLGALETLTRGGRPYIENIMTWRPMAVAPAKHTREEILARLQRFPDVGKLSAEEGKELDNSTYVNLTAADLPAVRDARRRMIQSISLDSFRAYFAVSRLLLNLINRLDAYPHYRKHPTR